MGELSITHRNNNLKTYCQIAQHAWRRVVHFRVVLCVENDFMSHDRERDITVMNTQRVCDINTSMNGLVKKYQKKKKRFCILVQIKLQPNNDTRVINLSAGYISFPRKLTSQVKKYTHYVQQSVQQTRTLITPMFVCSSQSPST